MFIGKEVIEIKQEFLSLNCVNQTMDSLDASNPQNTAPSLFLLRQVLMMQVLPACHGEHVVRIPKDAISCG